MPRSLKKESACAHPSASPQRDLVTAARRLTLLLAACVAAGPAPAHADTRSRITLLEENDSLYFNSDKHYTQGIRFSDLGPDVAPESGWNAPFDLFGGLGVLFPAAAERSRRYSLAVGQSVFTPKETGLVPPDRRDRPYAGWLYGSVALLQETDRRTLDHLELQFGVIGPASFGKETQNTWHQFLGIGEAKGWGDQLQNEPGIDLSYEKRLRLTLLGDGSGVVDVVPEAGATVGNVFTYGEAGALLRIGRNLGADYGPARIRPALSGTDYFSGDHLDGDFGFYVYAGVQGRAVGRNVFLDGNSFRSSPSVDKKPLVADLQAGISLFWSTALRLDFGVVRRTAEFEGQSTPDVIGTASLSFSW
jgi:lipid A 3-O-deacylase